MMAKYWTKKLKKGAYRQQLERLGVIKSDARVIPVDVSRRICRAKIGSKIKVNGRRITVTHLLKKRACAALALRKMSKHRR